MPRQLDPTFSAALQGGVILPFFAVDLQFKSGAYHLASTPWPITLGNGTTYTGTGSLGKIGAVRETMDVEATGITVTLSGVDTAILQECLEDIQLGAPATVYFGALNPANPSQALGNPSVYYQGLVDQPSHTSGPETCSISLAIESRMLRLQSGGQQRRYTSADQRITHPDDTFFSWVESLNDRALRFGY